MKGYVVANVHVENPSAYEDYRSRTAEVIERYGGRILVRGGEVEVVEGDPGIGRLVILEFPSVADAWRFYESPEYQAILPGRLNNAMSTLFVVNGV
jgi:uncharacterized protein (DUF1330 family)